MNSIQSWFPLEDRVFLCRDSCNVYAVRGAGDRWLIVNAGTGRCADRLGELGPVAEMTVLLTHHFRDHTAGAAAFRGLGASVLAPYWERDHLAGLQPSFRAREVRLQYDMAWDHFAPIEPVAVERWLMNYETMEAAGLQVEVIPAPGVSMGAAAYAVILPGGRRIAFVGELMAGPG